jgi:NAD(P)-dependent dehydrogenase (short-subunit alcohol dehydrogenase family)
VRAIVTGAGGGLGAGVADRLERDGGEVVRVDLRPGDGIEPADVADEAEVDALYDRALERLGGLDLLVNCAGIGGPGGPVAELDYGAFRRTLDVNLGGTFLMSRRAARAMIAQGTGGSIVNFGSIFGQQGVPFGAAYSSSKGAITLFTQSMALELAPHGIRVNTVSPGNMATEMHFEELRDRAARNGRSFDDELESARAEVPLGRHGTGEDIAGAIVWLASPDAAYVTGQTIGVNGGVLLS